MLQTDMIFLEEGEVIMKLMEHNIYSFQEFLNLIEYESIFIGNNFFEKFKKNIKNIKSDSVDNEIDKEIRKMQLLIFRLEKEDINSELMNFISMKVRHFLNDYIFAYIIIRSLKEDDLNGISYNENYKEQRVIDIIDNALSIVQNAEMEREKIRDYVKYIMENEL